MLLGWLKKKKSPEGEDLAQWGAAGAGALGAPGTPQTPGAPAAKIETGAPGALGLPQREPAPTPLADAAKAEGVWLALFANFEEPVRFAPVAALAESFTQGEDRAGFAAKKIGTRDDNLVQILLDEKPYASGKADIALAAEEASRRLKGVLGGSLKPGEYAGVAYPDSEGGMHQILTTPLDPGSDEPSQARIDLGENGEPVMTVAPPEPSALDADL